MNKAMKYLTPKKPISRIARDRAEEMEERNVDLYEAIAGLFEELAALEQSNAELKARVEMLEKEKEHPLKAVQTNILGTLNLLKITVEEQNIKFILATSTDKAVQVSGTYGATKLLMENLFEDLNK